MRARSFAVLAASTVLCATALSAPTAAADTRAVCDPLYTGTTDSLKAYIDCRLDGLPAPVPPATPSPTPSPTVAPTPTPSPTVGTVATVSDTTASSATLRWTGTSATGYLVGRDGTDAKGTGPWSTTDPATATSRVFGNLRAGTTYHLYVEPVGGTRQTVTATTAPGLIVTPSPTPSPTATQPTPTNTPTLAPATGQPVGVAGTWTATFADEFNGTAVDTTKWNAAYCKTMNNTGIDPANSTVAGGIATLRLAGGKGAMLSTASVDGCGAPSSPYTFPVGSYAEARANFPLTGTACANWPAWWSSGPAWPAAGEHDIAETLEGQLTGNYHSPSANARTYSGGAKWCGGWHTYGIHRKATSADLYWDGVKVATYPTSDNAAGEALILNIGTHSSNTDPAKTLQVDYVRAWKG